jgi:hypothetical protein
MKYLQDTLALNRILENSLRNYLIFGSNHAVTVDHNCDRDLMPEL